MKYSAILFDLDGTLLYTLEDITDALNRALETRGFPGRSVEEVRRFVGSGSGKLVERALPGGADGRLVKSVLEEYREDYAAHCNVKTRPYDGIKELLRELGARGIKLGLVSNKPDGAVRELAEAHFPGLFSAVTGERIGTMRKPAPDMVFAAMEEMGIGPEECLYIGDSEVDIATAENAGLPCVSVTWGFRSREELIKNGAAKLIDRPEELLEYF